MNFTIHITGSDFKGEADKFDWAKNFMRKYESANKELKQNNIKRISKIVASDIRATARRNKYHNLFLNCSIQSGLHKLEFQIGYLYPHSLGFYIYVP